MNISMHYRRSIPLFPTEVGAQPFQRPEPVALNYRPMAPPVRNSRVRNVLSATGELLLRGAKASPIGRLVFNGPTLLKHYFKVYFADTEPEALIVIFLDSQMQVIATEEFFAGTFTPTSVSLRSTDKDALHPLIGTDCGLVPEDYPIEVVERALHHNASAVALIYAAAVRNNADSSCAAKLPTTPYACAQG